MSSKNPHFMFFVLSFTLIGLGLTLLSSCMRKVDKELSYHPEEGSLGEPDEFALKGVPLEPFAPEGQLPDTPVFTLSSPFEMNKCQYPAKFHVLGVTEEIAEEYIFAALTGDALGVAYCGDHLFIAAMYSCQDRVHGAGSSAEVSVIIGLTISDPTLASLAGPEGTLYFEGLMTVYHRLPDMTLVAGNLHNLYQIDKNRNFIGGDDALRLTFFTFSDVENSFVIGLTPGQRGEAVGFLDSGYIDVSKKKVGTAGPGVFQRLYVTNPQDPNFQGCY